MERKKGTTPKEPERLKIGDNILIRDHISKAFQPKYKDFCIVGLLGKNQVKIKDNHGHVTKVHLQRRQENTHDGESLQTVRRRANRKN